MCKKLFNSIQKKYLVGYVLMIMSLGLIFAGSSAITIYLSNQYDEITKNIYEINKLEEALSTINIDVERVAIYFQENGLYDYPIDKQLVELSLSKVKEQPGIEYSRSIEDLVATAETYVYESSNFIKLMQNYLGQTGNLQIISYGLTQNYQELRQLYSYVENNIQEAYAHELERRQQALNIARKRIYNGLGVLLVVIIVLCMIYVRYVYGDIKNSIVKITKGVKDFQYNISGAKPIGLNSGDELENLADVFNDMQYIIRTQMKKISENADIKERLSKAENDNLKMYSALQKNHFDFLQSRINPHFLFNTLNMISSMAIIENNEHSAEMLTITASFLRYNLDNISKKVTLQQEVNNLKEYIQIQKCRYGDRFTYSYSIDKYTEKQLMPAMILQPLVENSIQHGIGMMQIDGKIWVETRLKEDKVQFVVKDNGEGMPQDQIEELKKNLKNMNLADSHIGLRNIFQRLLLFYSYNVDIEIIRLSPGLQISITVPYQDNGKV